MKSYSVALFLGLTLSTMAPLALWGAHHQQADATQKPDPKANDQYKIKLDLPPYNGPKKRLGVMDLEVKVTATATSTTNPTPIGGTTTTTTQTLPVSAPTDTDFGTGLTEMLTTALIDSNRFVILERKALTDIQAEQALGASPTVNPAAATTAGHLLGAQALIRGAVTEFSLSSSSSGTGGLVGSVLNLSHSDNTATVVLDIRIYDASTSVILDSVKGTGKVKTSANQAGVNIGNVSIGTSNFQDSPLGKATRQAIADCVKQICQRMDKYPWEARVAELEPDGSAIYINAGATMGIKEGDEFDIFHPGRDITDPETKTVIGRTRDTKCGHVKVDSVTPGLAIAKIVDGTGFAINDVVRFTTP